MQRSFLRNQQTVATGASPVQLFGPNDRRYALIISPPKTNEVFVSFSGDASGTSGLRIPPNASWIILMYDHVGQAFRESISVISPAGADQVGAIEIFEEDCDCDPKYAARLSTPNQKAINPYGLNK